MLQDRIEHLDRMLKTVTALSIIIGKMLAEEKKPFVATLGMITKQAEDELVEMGVRLPSTRLGEMMRYLAEDIHERFDVVIIQHRDEVNSFGDEFIVCTSDQIVNLVSHKRLGQFRSSIRS